MDVNDNAGNLTPRVVLSSIASLLAPTEDAKSPAFLTKRGFVMSNTESSQILRTPVDPAGAGARLRHARDGVASVHQACRGDRTANALAVASSIGNEKRKVAPRPGTSIN